MKPVNLPNIEQLPGKLKSRISAANNQVNQILDSRAELRLAVQADPEPAAETNLLLDQKREIASQFVDSFQAENLFWGHLDDLPAVIVEAARKIVKNAENDANTALERITAEIARFDLPFTNQNQERFFVTHCGQYLPFQSAANDLRSFEMAANQTVKNIALRQEWLISEFSRLRAQLLSSTNITAA